MVTGRAYATESRCGTAFEDEFGCEHRRASGMAGGRQGIRAQPRVRIEVHEAFAGCTRFEHFEILRLMHAFEFRGCRGACLDVQEVVVEMLDVKGIRDTR